MTPEPDPPAPRRRGPIKKHAEPWSVRRIEYLRNAGRIDDIQREGLYEIRRREVLKERRKKLWSPL